MIFGKFVCPGTSRMISGSKNSASCTKFCPNPNPEGHVRGRFLCHRGSNTPFLQKPKKKERLGQGHTGCCFLNFQIRFVLIYLFVQAASPSMFAASFAWRPARCDLYGGRTLRPMRGHGLPCEAASNLAESAKWKHAKTNQIKSTETFNTLRQHQATNQPKINNKHQQTIQHKSEQHQHTTVPYV